MDFGTNTCIKRIMGALFREIITGICNNSNFDPHCSSSARFKWFCLNRTIVGLKGSYCIDFNVWNNGLNRTIIGLKDIVGAVAIVLPCFKSKKRPSIL